MCSLIDYMQVFRFSATRFFSLKEDLKLTFNNDVEKYIDSICPVQYQLIYAHFLQSQTHFISVNYDYKSSIIRNKDMIEDNHKLLINFEELFESEEKALRLSEIIRLEEQKYNVLFRILNIKKALNNLHLLTAERKIIMKESLKSLDSTKKLNNVLKTINDLITKAECLPDISETLKTNLLKFDSMQLEHHLLVFIFIFLIYIFL